jgi:hypothetical protein
MSHQFPLFMPVRRSSDSAGDTRSSFDFTFHLSNLHPTAKAWCHRMPGMFRGSGHNSGISDSDDSYYSSSDEDSLSDSPERRFPLRPEHDITEPRKVTLVRDALDTAYHMVAMVSEPRMDVSQLGFKPWKALGQALKTIGENGNDSRVSSVLDMEALVRT